MSDCKPLNMVFDSDSETNECQENSFSSDLNFESPHTKSKATSSSPTATENSNVVPLDRQNISLDWEDDFEKDNFLIIQEKKKQPVKKKKDFDEKQRTQWKTSKAFQKYRLKNQIWFRKPKIISDFENGRACPAINEFVSLLNSEDTRIDFQFKHYFDSLSPIAKQTGKMDHNPPLSGLPFHPCPARKRKKIQDQMFAVMECLNDSTLHYKHEVQSATFTQSLPKFFKEDARNPKKTLDWKPLDKNVLEDFFNFDEPEYNPTLKPEQLK